MHGDEGDWLGTLSTEKAVNPSCALEMGMTGSAVVQDRCGRVGTEKASSPFLWNPIGRGPWS